MMTSPNRVLEAPTTYGAPTENLETITIRHQDLTISRLSAELQLEKENTQRWYRGYCDLLKENDELRVQLFQPGGCQRPCQTGNASFGSGIIF